MRTHFISHLGPIWCLSWAHPIFGRIFATGGNDHFLKIWSINKNTITPIHSEKLDDSINCIEFGPKSAGFLIILGLENGKIIALKQIGKSYFPFYIQNEKNIPISSISWAPDFAKDLTPQFRFVTGGYDSRAIIWEYNDKLQTQIKYLEILPIEKRGFIHSVCWNKNIGLLKDLIVIGSEAGLVEIFTYNDNKWSGVSITDFGFPIWQVSWSQTGCILSVLKGNNQLEYIIVINLYRKHLKESGLK